MRPIIYFFILFAFSTAAVAQNQLVEILADSLFSSEVNDQSSDSTGAPLLISANVYGGQSFIADTTGILTRIEVSVRKAGFFVPDAWLSLEIKTGSDPAMGSSLITESFIVSDFLIAIYWIVLTTPIEVTKGDSLVMIVKKTSGGDAFWERSLSDVYAGGTAFVNASGWIPLSNQDHWFSSYIEVPDNAIASYFSVADDGLIKVKNRITNVTDPISAQDAATKAYVDVDTRDLLILDGHGQVATPLTVQNGIASAIKSTGNFEGMLAENNTEDGIESNSNGSDGFEANFNAVDGFRSANNLNNGFTSSVNGNYGFFASLNDNSGFQAQGNFGGFNAIFNSGYGFRAVQPVFNTSGFIADSCFQGFIARNCEEIGFNAYQNVSDGVRSIGNGNDGFRAFLNDDDGIYALDNGGDQGYFAGNVTVTGNLSKGGGSFKIDHPLDPENKFLYHSFVESPDMMNVYNGNVILDANGEAVVELEEWFETLNRDFRYQLTAIGAPGPNLYLAKKIQNKRFKIAGGTPGKEVSWQVTGIRQDPYANAHRIKVEVEKPVEFKGYYLHPEAYGHGFEQGFDFVKMGYKTLEDIRAEMEAQAAPKRRAQQGPAPKPVKRE